MLEYVSSTVRSYQTRTAQGDRRPGRPHRTDPDRPARRRPRPDRRRARDREDADRQNSRANHQRELRPHPVHTRSDAFGYHRHERFQRRDFNFQSRQGPVFTDILLADEINRTPPKTQAALLEAMEERQVTIDGEGQSLSPLFTVLATENPIEYEGTYPLPEAQLDRFLLKILLDYPRKPTNNR